MVENEVDGIPSSVNVDTCFALASIDCLWHFSHRKKSIALDEFVFVFYQDVFDKFF